jgi:hypothetical protein
LSFSINSFQECTAFSFPSHSYNDSKLYYIPEGIAHNDATGDNVKGEREEFQKLTAP